MKAVKQGIEGYKVKSASLGHSSLQQSLKGQMVGNEYVTSQSSSVTDSMITPTNFAKAHEDIMDFEEGD